MPSIPSILALVASFAVAVTANPANHSPFKNKNFVVDAHRGALGHRTENTLWVCLVVIQDKNCERIG